MSMRRLRGFVPLCLVTASFQLPPKTGGGVNQGHPGATAAPGERKGSLRERLRQHFPAQYRDSIKLFWEPSDPPLRADLLGDAKVDLAEVFAYFRQTASVFPPAGVATKCAVVGSSSNLLASRHGEAIDRHDVVLRINLAPTRGLEVDVGRRTTHYLVTHWILDLVLDGEDCGRGNLDGRLLSLANGAYWLVLYRPHDDSYPMRLLMPQVRKLAGSSHPVPRDRSRLVHPEFTVHVEDWKMGAERSPSTGLVGIMLALHVCDEVDVYGFGPDAGGRRGFYYKQDVHVEHGPDMEEILLGRLAAASLITVHSVPDSREPVGRQ